MENVILGMQRQRWDKDGRIYGFMGVITGYVDSM